MSLADALDLILGNDVMLRDHGYVVFSSRRIFDNATWRRHVLALCDKRIYAARCVRGVKTWKQRTNVWIIEAILGMGYL